jgi:hypothetical protein
MEGRREWEKRLVIGRGGEARDVVRVERMEEGGKKGYSERLVLREVAGARLL